MIQYSGLWWLSYTKGKKIHGTLHISCKGEAFLNLVSPIEENNQNGDEYELIFGVSNNGKLISLQYCLVNETPAVYPPGLKTQKISAENVYITRIFSNAECGHYDPSLKSDEVIVKFTYLNDWLNFPLFELDVEKNNDIGVTYNIKHSPPHEYETDFNIGDIKGNLKICLGFGENGYRYDDPAKIFAEHYFESGIKITIDKPLDIYEWYDCILNYIREFLMLATLKPNLISGLTTFHNIKGKDFPVEIYSRQTVTSRSNHKIYSHQMLFSFESVKSNLSDIINDWFDLCHKFGYIFSIFFSTIQSDGMYLEHKFLSLAQTLEAYHRSLNPLKKVEYIDKKGRKRIRELYFRERLEELMNNLKYGVMPNIICDTNYFFDTVKDTRNFLTHIDATYKSRIADNHELLVIIDQLSALIQALILTSLKISDKNVLTNYMMNKKRLFLRFDHKCYNGERVETA